jgi:hypothetical protein
MTLSWVERVKALSEVERQPNHFTGGNGGTGKMNEGEEDLLSSLRFLL